MTNRIYLNNLGIHNPLGFGKTAVAKNLFQGSTAGMIVEYGLISDEEVFVGKVAAELPAIELKDGLFDTRNNRLLQSALLQIEQDVQAAIERYGLARIAVVIGTSTSGISDNELALLEYSQCGSYPENFAFERQAFYNPAEFTARYFGLGGPTYGISTACTSSAKTFASARRLIAANLCDAAIVGGADTLCKLTLNGFSALEALSDQRCNPFSRNRRGINIGEGSAVFLISREEAPVRLAGIGESSDAHHMSAPDPEGNGAYSAMSEALSNGGLEPRDIDYINMHGTATLLNDAMEAKSITRLFGADASCSSTKPMTGHMLGAAGANEIAFLWLALQENYSQNQLPPHIWDGEQDPQLPGLNLVPFNAPMANNMSGAMLSNSFAFGGSNISVALARS